MTPEERRQLQELYDWMQARKLQQLTYPVDDLSKNALGVPVFGGAGSTTKTQVYTDSRGDTVTAPKAYAQTVILIISGARYEIPSLI